MWVGVGVGVGVDFSKPESESESESLKFGRLRSSDYNSHNLKKSSARLRAPGLPEPMTAADRAVVALRTRRHNRSK